MYRYSEFDKTLINERVVQFQDQTRRFLAGEITEAEFLPLRLQNGLYVQRHAPMLRIAVPYGTLSSKQFRKLAYIAKNFDKDYVHLTTRQNVQINWPKLEQVPEILSHLAEVEMHAVQTSGNCIRNVTSDEFAGCRTREIEDPRPYCELIRQWSTLHPEFAFLPRKFKIAVNANPETDRAAIKVHDIGLELTTNEAGEAGFQVFVGGGLGRTPIIGSAINDFLPREHILSYLEAILRVYNRYGRRDNKYKARIKILVKALGVQAFKQKVEQQWLLIKESDLKVPESEFRRLKSFFTPPSYQLWNDSELAATDATLAQQALNSLPFKRWLSNNVQEHKTSGYSIVTLSIKKTGHAPGDMQSQEMLSVADLCDQFSFGELRISHQQNLVFSDVKRNDLHSLWQKLTELGLATPNIGRITDVICCPGGDFCALANAKSIPIAESIQRHFEQLDYQHDLGELDLNISGCMNACGHHHVGQIGILGVDKKGKEYYQISLGGSSYRDAAIGKILGPSFERDEVVSALDKIIHLFIEQRHAGETFLSVVNRLGLTPFKEATYAKAD